MTLSQKFAVTCLAILVGAAISSYVEISTIILGWVTVMWLIIALSGQADPFETIAFILFGLSFGALLWQMTSGEVWLSLSILTKVGAVLATWRDAIIDKISLALPEPQGSLMSGILLGNRVKLNQDLINTFRAVGLTHIIAVSGYNLTILTANAVSIFWPIIGRRSLWVSAAIIVVFVLITGAPASILRAAVMAITVIVAKYLGRPSRGINVLIFGATVLALFEPKILFDIGFQLSVAATYGLIRLSPYLGRILSRTFLPKTLQEIMAETLAAIIMTTPLIIGHFERLSVISPVSNILVLPLIPLAMAIGIIAIPLLLAIPAVGNVLMLASWPLLTWIIFISQRLQALPFASTNLTLPVWIIAGLMVILVGGLEWLNYRRPLKADLFEQLMFQPNAV